MTFRILGIIVVCFAAAGTGRADDKLASDQQRLVVAPDAKKAVAFPPLPQAVSSFGAAAADGWVYVYGGHQTKTHTYSTEAVRGSLHRLNLSEPKAWEELPSGVAAQGLALVEAWQVPHCAALTC